MAIYQITNNHFSKINETTFLEEGIKERSDLQRLLRNQIDVISPDTLVIAEEFGEWEDSKRRIDLLGLDKQANLVVIELKRTEDGGHMELQAIRYAAMVSALTFDQVVDIFGRYLESINSDIDPKEKILEFLEWDEPDEDSFAQEVKIVLASAKFSKELTTSVIWLNNYGLDIKCIRIQPYNDDGKVYIDVQQVIPLPEAEDYQVQIRNKSRLEKISRTQNRDLTKYDVTIEELTQPHLPKRRAIFSIVKYLVDSGANPEEIKSIINWKSDALVSIDGELDSLEFEKKLAEQLIQKGKKPETQRFFIGEDELMHYNGKTYALTKMWGTRTAEAMDLLIQRYPDEHISYKESEQ